MMPIGLYVILYNLYGTSWVSSQKRKNKPFWNPTSIKRICGNTFLSKLIHSILFDAVLKKIATRKHQSNCPRGLF